ncbi:MAG TPA: DMT family transporter [Bradyrhizobium sp.]|nr:DMT family transporter [Bradyrhizobium sp.]
MTESAPRPSRRSLPPAGIAFLAVTTIGWGLNWPANKYLLSQLPPLTLRGGTGVVGAALLVCLAMLRGQSLRVPRQMWPRLVLAGLLNVTGWMVLMGLALVYLPASEAALIAYTMPVWAAALAWPVLGERPTLMRGLALVMALAGLSAIMGGNGMAGTMEKLPGILMALGGSIGFAVGTVLAKRWPLTMPPIPAAAWQIGIGCAPVALAGGLLETAHVSAVTPVGWVVLVYSTVVQFCVAYVCWFAALSRLPASAAATGTMVVPVIGVAASALALHEPLGPGQIAALLLTLVAVALATRS